MGYLLGAGLHGAALGGAQHASAGTRHAWPAGAGSHGAAHAGHGVALAMAWAALRFGAGVASAVVLLNIAAWCMLRLVALGQPALGGLIFSGPGLGIALTGLSASAMVAWHWPAAAGWAVFGLLCVGAVCAGVAGGAGVAAGGCCSQLRTPGVANPGLGPAARGALTLAYGLAGWATSSPPRFCR